jgi:leucyl-tRNA synthetase
VGADGLRLFHHFVGPPADDVDWTEQTEALIEGCGRFIDRVWRLAHEHEVYFHDEPDERDAAVRQVVHRTIAKVTYDIDRWGFNTAVAALMELVNTVSKWARSDQGAERAIFDEAVDTLLCLLAPMTPHVTAELWEMRHPDRATVHHQRWPVADDTLVREATVTMAVEVNGKVRARVEIAPDASEADAEALALADPRVVAALAGRSPSRVISRPPRLVNVIV